MEPFNTPISISNIPFNFNVPTSSSGTTTNSITNIWMDSRIWSRLPHRILDRIIAFLPPAAFFRSRSVCKRWYALLFSNPFLELYLQISPTHHCFLFFKQKTLKTKIYTNNNNNNDPTHTHEGYLFEPKTLTWHRIPFPLVPAGFSPASSSGGLVCWVSDEAGSKSLVLSNPLFGNLLTPLPSTPRPRLFPSIGLKISSSSIDIVVAGDDMISPYAVKNLTTESFHVDGGGFFSIWGTNSSLPRLCSLETGQMVHSKGKFYCMNFSPFSVLCYDIQTSNWCKIQAPMRRFLRSPCLVESKERVLLVAAVEKSKLNVPKSLRIWGLQACGSNNWVEIERMPQQLYVHFAEIEGGRGFNCVGNGEFVGVVIRGTERALLFDFWKKRWIWIPPCPFVSGGDGDGGELHGFAYEPRLATPVVGLLDQLTLPFQSFNG